MKAITEKTTTGFSAFIEYKKNTIVATGKSMNELIKSMNNAIELLSDNLEKNEATKLKSAKVDYIM